MDIKVLSVSFGYKQYEICSSWRSGGDELIFMIHGLGCSKEIFDGVWNYPGFEEYSILAIDLLGFGRSSKPVDFSFSMEDQACICGEILRNSRYSKLHIVAHSMGGAVALLLPETFLTSIESFANLEGNLIEEDCGILSRKAISVPYSQFNKEGIEYSDKEHMSLEDTSSLAYYRSAESLVEWSDSGRLLEKFRNLSCYKAYFFGEGNGDHPTVSRMDGIRQIRINKSGHFFMKDNPDEFYEKLLKIIKGR